MIPFSLLLLFGLLINGKKTPIDAKFGQTLYHYMTALYILHL